MNRRHLYGTIVLPQHEILEAAGPRLRDQERVFRRHVIAAALAAARGNRTVAARTLGIRRPWLVELMRRLGLQEFARARAKRL